MSHRPVRRSRITAVVVAVAAACLLPLLGPGSAAAADASRIAAGNATLVPRLQAAGGVLTPDGRWVTMPDGAQVSLRPTVFADCPAGKVCLWTDANYTGRMVFFSGTAQTVPDLSTVMFDNTMTSWGNRTSGLDARWFYNTNNGGTTRCMNAASGNSNVGATDNDQASSLRIYTDAAACS